MPFVLALLCLLPFVPLAHAQPAPAGKPPAVGRAPAAEAPSAAAAGGKPAEAWRDTGGYRFPALARTVADMQNLAHAMRLRDYCADGRVPDAFVRERLRRFGELTGREESCQTLLDY